MKNEESKIKNQKSKMHELNRKSLCEYKHTKKLPLVVVLDNVRSSHNIGSIFRTCDAFMIEEIYICGISATPPNREIHKSALGAEDSVDWKYFNTTMQAVENLQSRGYEMWGVEQTQNSCSLEQFSIDTGKRYALVFGNEVRGIDQDVIDCCSGCVEIPQFGTKHSFKDRKSVV